MLALIACLYLTSSYFSFLWIFSFYLFFCRPLY